MVRVTASVFRSSSHIFTIIAIHEVPQRERDQGVWCLFVGILFIRTPFECLAAERKFETWVTLLGLPLSIRETLREL